MKIEIDFESRYDVIAERGTAEQAGELVKSVFSGEKACIISDSKVFKLYGEKFTQNIEKAGIKACSFVFEEGESSKNLTTFCRIVESMGEMGLRRDDAVIGLGGGVTGDMAAFAASVYMRGIKYIAVPTTLLSMVDSSVGGKTAVDLKSGKNLAGTFYQPSLVLIDSDFLKTLSQEQIACGMAEVIKYGMIADKELFELLENNPNPDIDNIICTSVRIKREFVRGDEKDTGKRKILNFGHTIGHSIEKECGYSMTHGHAVAIGMAAVTRALKGGEISARLERLLKSYGLPTSTDISAERIWRCAQNDKKGGRDGVDLIVPLDIGNCQVKKVGYDELYEIIKAGI